MKIETSIDAKNFIDTLSLTKLSRRHVARPSYLFIINIIINIIIVIVVVVSLNCFNTDA